MCLSPPLLAPPRPCLCGRKPPTFQSLDPALGLPTHPPFPLSRAHFRPGLFFCPVQKLQWLVRKRMEPAFQGSWGHSLCPRTPLRDCWGLALLPFVPLTNPQEGGNHRVSLRLLLLCGHHHPHTLLEETFPPFSGSRAPSAPTPPIRPSKPLPQDASECVALSVEHIEDHAFSCACSRRRGSEIHLLCFLEASCRPGCGWGNSGDSRQAERISHWVRGWGRGVGGGWVGGVRESFSKRWSKQTLSWVHRGL